MLSSPTAPPQTKAARLGPQHSIRNRLSSIRADARAVTRIVSALQDCIAGEEAIKRPLVSLKDELSYADASACIEASSISRPARSIAVLANERCGSWYVPPTQRAGSVYFKSTDGHRNEWAFSTRRLNWSLLEALGLHGVCVIVDSTRAHAMSDALSKTVPIWTAVMNRLLFPECIDYHGLQVPPCVELAECTSIKERMNSFMATVRTLDLDTASLRETLRKPIQVRFCSVMPGSTIPTAFPAESHHLICLSASVPGSVHESFTYIPGAGDDAEHWARGLTPDLFWNHSDMFLPCLSEDEIESNVDEICLQARFNDQSLRDGSEETFNPIRLTDVSFPFYIGSLDHLAAAKAGRYIVDGAIVCCEPEGTALLKTKSNPNGNMVNESTDPRGGSANASKDSSWKGDGAYQSKHDDKFPILKLCCPPGKLGSRALRGELQRIAPFLQAYFASNPSPCLLFASVGGLDLAVAAALTVACKHMDSQGRFQVGGMQNEALEAEGKVFVRRQLVQILRAMGWNEAAVAEDRGLRSTTLKAVNEFVMGRKLGKKAACQKITAVPNQESIRSETS